MSGKGLKLSKQIIYGHSMEPEIRDWDIGIFEPPNGLQPAENDVVAVELEGHWTVDDQTTENHRPE